MDYTLNVKAAMVKAGKTQEQLAKDLNMSKSTLSKKLNKKDGNCFSIDEACRISEILNATFVDIFLIKEVA